MELEARPPQIVIGTPGRTLYLVRKNHLDFSKLNHFILDECDKMLEQYGKLFLYYKQLY